MRRNRNVNVVMVTSLIALSVASGAAPAAADEAHSIYDAQAILGSIAPEILGQTFETGVAEDVSEQRRPGAGLTVSFAAPDYVVQAAAEVTEIETVVSAPLSFVIEDARTQVANVDGIEVWSTHDDSAATYVQPLEGGVRVLTAIADADAPTAYSYAIDAPAGSELRPSAVGYILYSPNGQVLGSLHDAWARDSNGQAVPTRYEWVGGVLTQHVDLSDPSIAYPVLADPAWTYGVAYAIETRTVSQIRSQLLNCFNCDFPVAGAPANFPSMGQFLPLTVGLWNFNCTMQSVYYDNNGGGMAWFGWYFSAAASHVDGLGSTISFDFSPAWKPEAPSNVFAGMAVNAWIMNSNPAGVPREYYIAGAVLNWATFASNLSS